VGQRSTEPNSALEYYDFLHGSFKRESKERLLELMADARDLEQLAKLDQPRLARSTVSAWRTPCCSGRENFKAR